MIEWSLYHDLYRENKFGNRRCIIPHREMNRINLNRDGAGVLAKGRVLIMTLFKHRRRLWRKTPPSWSSYPFLLLSLWGRKRTKGEAIFAFDVILRSLSRTSNEKSRVFSITIWIISHQNFRDADQQSRI